jgi:hypothetical protein
VHVFSDFHAHSSVKKQIEGCIIGLLTTDELSFYFQNKRPLKQ